MKIAMSGSSGSGKTTLGNWIADEFNLKHIPCSAGDLLDGNDLSFLKESFNYEGNEGHYGVIKRSAENGEFGYLFQNMLLNNRTHLISNNDDFIMDRSPVDNLTYFISQVGFHPGMEDRLAEIFIQKCFRAWNMLTHVIYVKAVQPGKVENNGSRIVNKYWQQAIDAQFDHWFKTLFFTDKNPKILRINFWDLEGRKQAIREFLKA